MAILCCQLDYSWNELQSRRGGYTCERFSAWLEVANLFLVWTPEVGKYTPLIWTLWQEDTPLIRATFPAASLYKEHKRISLLSYSSRNTWQLRIALLTVSLALPHISRKYTTGLLMGQSGWSIFLVELSSSIKTLLCQDVIILASTICKYKLLSHKMSEILWVAAKWMEPVELWKDKHCVISYIETEHSSGRWWSVHAICMSSDSMWTSTC